MYRVQPKDMDIAGHASMTTNDESDPHGVHVFGTLSEARKAPKSWISQDWEPELITIEVPTKALRDNGDYEGYAIDPKKGKIVHRESFKSWNHFIGR